MGIETEKKLYEIINQIPITDKNKNKLLEIKLDIQSGEYEQALAKLRKLNNEDDEELDVENDQKEEDTKGMYPVKLENQELEYTYMGLLLENPKSISRYYYLNKECYFEDDKILNVYKSVLFTEGGKYTPEIAKEGFSFAKDSEEVYNFKNELKKKVRDKQYDIEEIYTDLKKLFILRVLNNGLIE